MSAPVLHNGPCPMFLAVLATNLGAQKHGADSRVACTRARSLVGTTGVLANLSSAKSSACRDQTPRKSKKSRPVGEVRLTQGVDAEGLPPSIALLRLRRYRPRCRAAGPRNGLTPPHRSSLQP